MSTESGEASKAPKTAEKQTRDSPSGVTSHRAIKKEKGGWKHWLIGVLTYCLSVIKWDTLGIWVPQYKLKYKRMFKPIFIVVVGVSIVIGSLVFYWSAGCVLQLHTKKNNFGFPYWVVQNADSRFCKGLVLQSSLLLNQRTFRCLFW
jgi:hypothetical protein